MECILLKETFEDENFMVTKVIVKLFPLKIALYMRQLVCTTPYINQDDMSLLL